MERIKVKQSFNFVSTSVSLTRWKVMVMLLMLCAFVFSLPVAADPPYFSVDPVSPIVTVHGRSGAEILDPTRMFPPAAPLPPPPSGTCATPGMLGLIGGDNVDAISRQFGVFPGAVNVYAVNGRYASNTYWWSVDRASVGASVGGGILCELFAGPGIVSSMGTPVFEETSSLRSACGDIFGQMWVNLTAATFMRFNVLSIDESDIQETGGAFGAGGLDELDGLDTFPCRDADYFFSVDPATAVRLGVSPASILRVDTGGGSWTEVITAGGLGLVAADDIDALHVSGYSDRGLAPSWSVIFSLARGSPSLVEAGTGFTWSPGDLFFVTTFLPYPGINTVCDGPDNRCWMHAEYLSLLPSDNLDGLQVVIMDPGCSAGDTTGAWGAPDCEVDIHDLGNVSSHWQDGSCSDPNWCGGTDYDHSGDVGAPDLLTLAGSWREEAQPSDPNDFWPDEWKCPTQCYGNVDCLSSGSYQVSLDDLSLFTMAYGSSIGDANYDYASDFDHDYDVDDGDLGILQNWFDQIGVPTDCQTGP